jgi:hypothetical protein
MKKLLFVISVVLIVTLFPIRAAHSKEFLTVAVIDTGLDKDILSQGYSKGICRYGHRDFTGKGLHDVNGHGTNVSGLIHKYAQGSQYCQVILKTYHDKATGAKFFTEAIEYAINLKVDIINISGGGSGSNMAEYKAVKKALDNGIKLIFAAGNNAQKLGVEGSYFPAMYDDRITVVASSKGEYSNTGECVDTWENGTNQVGDYGWRMTGTSQATAIYTGKTIRRLK